MMRMTVPCTTTRHRGCLSLRTLARRGLPVPPCLKPRQLKVLCHFPVTTAECIHC